MTNLVSEVVDATASIPGETWSMLKDACILVVTGIIAIVRWCFLI